MKLWILQRQAKEKEFLSYESARFLEEARVLGIDLDLVAAEEIDLIVSRGGARSIRRCGEEVNLPDGLLPRAGSGSDTFTLAVLRQFEQLSVPVINSSQAVEDVKDKLVCLQRLACANLPIPRTMLVRFPVDCDLVERQIGFPCVVKVLVGSHGEGIYLSRDRSTFRDLMELVASLNGHQSLILQNTSVIDPVRISGSGSSVARWWEPCCGAARMAASRPTSRGVAEERPFRWIR